MRQSLNGYSTTSDTQSEELGGLGANLSNKGYIKQVKKKYMPDYQKTDTNTSNDYLWLLACSEVVKDGYNGIGTYGYARGSEGSQYKYYKQYATESWNLSSKNRKKSPKSGSAFRWWLRSPVYNSSRYFCHMYTEGYVTNANPGGLDYGVAPGFCI